MPALHRAWHREPGSGLAARSVDGTSFVGLAGDQFCSNLGEKAFSFCGERDKDPLGLKGTQEVKARPGPFRLSTRGLHGFERVSLVRTRCCCPTRGC